MPTASRVDPGVVLRALDGRRWAHTTSRIVAMGWDFAVRTDLPELGAHLDAVLQEMAAPGAPAHVYSLLADQRPTYVRHRLYRDGTRILDTPAGSLALQHLLWDVNQQLFAHTTDRIVVHAAVTEHAGRAMMLTAPSDAGKTTLAVGLVERGMGYLSDEAAGIDPATLDVHPYAKPLSIDDGAQAMFDRFRPTVDPAIAEHLEGRWQLAPSWIRPGSASGPVPPAWIVTPRYVRGSATSLEPISRAEALATLMGQELNLHHFGAPGFHALAELTRRCRCFRLVSGSLDEACDLLFAMCEEGPLDG